MKFSSLKLSGLPQRGIIGVEGPNESGKTTIGEAILFAFFGKTRASQETSVSRLIRWGADYLSVEVEFHIPGRGDFLIYREIDKYGTNYVKVIDLATRTEAAAGNVNVSEFLARTLKFDFFEFHQSFYHDQEESRRSREAQANFVERMSGIAQLRDAAQAFRKEIEGLEREFSHYQKDIQRNLQQVEKYDRNIAKLPELRESARARGEEMEKARTEHRRRQEDVEAYRRLGEGRGALVRRLEGLTEDPADGILTALAEISQGLKALPQGSTQERDFAVKCADDLRSHQARIDEIVEMLRQFQAFRAACQNLADEVSERLDPEGEEGLVVEEERLQAELGLARRRARRLLIGGGALLILAGLCGGIAEAHRHGLLAGFWPPAVPAWAGYAAGGLLFLLSVVLFSLRRGVSRRANQLQSALQNQALRIQEETAEREKLAALLSIRGPGEVVRFVKTSEGLADRPRTEIRRELQRVHRVLLEGEGDGEYRKAILSLSRMEREFRTRILKEAQRAEKTVQEAEAAVRKSRGDLDKVESEIRECESQAQRKEALQGKNRELHVSSGELRGSIDLRRLAIELLDDTGASIRNKIGPSLSRFMKQLLPKLTRGRYRDIKVGSDLTLQVFTSDKSDFLEPAELSGGTHEALNLALRLATSQAFIATRTLEKQFVFLDEPFKMMDEGRALEAIGVLGSLSADLPQVFVIQPNFTAAQREMFDWLVRTSIDRPELCLPGQQVLHASASHPSVDVAPAEAALGPEDPLAGPDPSAFQGS